MIFQGFKETILKKQFHKLLLQKEQNKTSALKKIQSIGIISTDAITSKMNLKEEIDSILDIRNSKIYSLRDFNKNDALSYNHFTEKDINWNAKFTQTNFKSFLDQPFDLLIGYFDTSNIFLESAVLQSNAVFKVGFSNVNSNLYDIEISEKTENVVAFISELKKYLQIIKKL